MKLLEIYKEIYKEILFFEKKTDIQKIIQTIESLNDQEYVKEELAEKLGLFSKPYPMPLYLFSFLSLIKLCSLLKKSINQNYEYYFEIYSNLRKKEELPEDENKLFKEVSEILYRIDEINQEYQRIVQEVLYKIKTIYFSKVDVNDTKIFFIKISKDDYSSIYPIYEELIYLILNLLDEKKIEKGLFQLCQFLSKKE